MKILVGVPCMESIPVETCQSLNALQKSGLRAGYDIDIHYEPLSVVHIARERITEIAVKGEYDYLLFIDSDMVFPGGILRQLIKDDKDIVSGLAFMRKPPYNPCVYKTMKIGECGQKEEERLEDFNAGLVEIDGCGLACCLIKVPVLKDLRSRNSSLYWPMFGYGEDLSFCIKARQGNKYKLWCDTRVKVGHIGKIIVMEDDYQAWKGANK